MGNLLSTLIPEYSKKIDMGMLYFAHHTNCIIFDLLFDVANGFYSSPALLVLDLEVWLIKTP